MAGFYGGYMGNAGALENANNLAASPSFEIPGAGSPGGLSGRSIDQLRRLQESIPGGNIQTGGTQMGNAGFFTGPQYGQMPAGFQNKTIS